MCLLLGAGWEGRSGRGGREESQPTSENWERLSLRQKKVNGTDRYREECLGDQRG